MVLPKRLALPLAALQDGHDAVLIDGLRAAAAEVSAVAGEVDRAEDHDEADGDAEQPGRAAGKRADGQAHRSVAPRRAAGCRGWEFTPGLSAGGARQLRTENPQEP